MTDPADGARVRSLATRNPLLTVGQWLAISIGAASLLAIVAVAIALVANRQTDHRRHVLVDETTPALLTTSELTDALVNQETGLRGFELTHQRTFLSPFNQGVADQRRAYRSLASYLGGTGRLHADLTALKRAASAWRTAFVSPVLAGKGNTKVDAAGKDKFDVIRARLTRLTHALSLRRDGARAQLDRDSRRLTKILIFVGVLIILGLAVAGLLLRRIITLPLSRLGREIRRVAGGDFAVPLADVRGAREIVAVRGEVETMRSLINEALERATAAQAQLQRQAAELERSNSDLEQFAYVASHDLQEPLRKVASFCQALERRYAGQLDERADQYIHFAVDGAKRMQVLINDLLAFSRVGRGDRALETVPARRLVDHALSALEQVITETSAEIVVSELPTVAADPALLASVFQNLIGNAIKFRGERPPVVHVDAVREGEEWIFTITDNGIGIEPEYGERIFMIFQRLHSRDQYAGTGIGLAVTRKIIEYHHGTIALDPGYRDGTRIRFSLPALEEEPDEPDAG